MFAAPTRLASFFVAGLGSLGGQDLRVILVVFLNLAVVRVGTLSSRLWRERQAVVVIRRQRQAFGIVVGRQCQAVVRFGFIHSDRFGHDLLRGSGGYEFGLFEDSGTKGIVFNNRPRRECWLGNGFWNRLGNNSRRRCGRFRLRLRGRNRRNFRGGSEFNVRLRDDGGRFHRLGKLDLEHVVVEQVVVATLSIQIDSEKVLSQPGPIVCGVIVLWFFTHGTESNLSRLDRQPSFGGWSALTSCGKDASSLDRRGRCDVADESLVLECQLLSTGEWRLWANFFVEVA